MTRNRQKDRGGMHRFVVVILAAGATAVDEDHAGQHPLEIDRVRPVLPGELEEFGAQASGATDVYVYGERDFDGRPTGQRHRMFLRRVEVER